MQPQEIILVQRSFQQVWSVAEHAATLFYEQLFALDPSLRPMFPTNMRKQKAKLIEMLQAIVNDLDHLDKLIPTVQAMGYRHAAYGVTNAHYVTLGAALMATFQQVLGPAWTLEVETAWTAAYAMIAAAMQAAVVGDQGLLVA